MLIAERDKLNRAITALQGAGHASSPTPAVRKRKGLSAAQRAAHSARMKAYWAAKRKAAKK